MQTEIFELIKKAIEDFMPANKILGIKVLEIKSGYAHIHVPFKEEFVGDFIQGRWHGGILASVADTAGGIAGATALLSSEDKLNTIDMRMDYLHAATNRDIEARAQVIKNGKTIIKVDIQLFQDPKAPPVAIARCVYSVIRTDNGQKPFNRKSLDFLAML
jgi:uncharacterized protein (TIGR00369 family)